MAPFAGLSTDVFSAYSPEKWSSNVHNLARMKAKGAIIKLCDAANVSLGDLARGSSDEVPNISNQKKVDAQWVYWFRNPEARTELASFLRKTPLTGPEVFNLAPQDKHASLTVIVRETDVWVGLRVASGASIDRRNLAAKLASEWDRNQLLELLAELPSGAAAGFLDDTMDAAGITGELLEEHGRTMPESKQPWVVGNTFAAQEAIQLENALADDVGRWLSALMPLYVFAAWSRDNDKTEFTKEIQEEKTQKRREAAGYLPGERVRVISGLFSGKLGLVLETDTKAQVKIQVGKMTVVVPGMSLTRV